MSQEQQKQQEKQILIAYVLMFLTIFSIIPLVFAYWIAARVSTQPEIEVWLSSHAFWIARNLTIFICIAIFSALWFIPLGFLAWNHSTWTMATTIIGVIFAIIAWLYLLNAWIKGIFRYIKHKPVY